MDRFEIVSVEVVPWESGQWGVSIKYHNGDGKAYSVGDRAAADTEAAKIRAKPRPSSKVA